MDFELIIIIASNIALAGIVAAYLKLQNEFAKFKRDKESIHSEAREKAVRVVETAKEKALEILSEAKSDSLRESETIDMRLQEISENKLREYKKMLQKVSESIEDTAVRELSEYKKTLTFETAEGQKIMEQKMTEAMTAAQEQIENYKAQKMAEIDERIEKLIKKITLQVLGKGLRIDDQTKIVISALEKAKKDGLFE